MADPYSFGAIGDGVADDTGAFRRALEHSRHVVVPEGTFRLSGLDLDGRTLVGAGGVILKPSKPPYAIRMLGDRPRLDRLIFRSMGADGQPNSEVCVGEGCRDALVSDCRFATGRYLYSAICGATDTRAGGRPYGTPADGLTIRDCVFSGKYARPVYLHSIRNIRIAGNTFRDCVFDAIRLREDCVHTQIADNTFINVGERRDSGHETADAVDAFWGGGRLIITGNVVAGAGYHGFDLKLRSPDGSAGVSEVIVGDNQIHGCRRSGIVLRGGITSNPIAYNQHVIIRHNLVSGCNDENREGRGDRAVPAIHAEGPLRCVSIVDNHAYENYGRGVVASGGDRPDVPASYGFVVRGNIAVNNGCPVRKDGEGIRVSGIGDMIFEGNQAFNDPLRPNAGAQARGLVGLTN
jgi:hypothetical protein